MNHHVPWRNPPPCDVPPCDVLLCESYGLKKGDQSEIKNHRFLFCTRKVRFSVENSQNPFPRMWMCLFFRNQHPFFGKTNPLFSEAPCASQLQKANKGTDTWMDINHCRFVRNYSRMRLDKYPLSVCVSYVQERQRWLCSHLTITSRIPCPYQAAMKFSGFISLVFVQPCCAPKQ